MVFIVQIAACRKPSTKDLFGSWQVDFANSKCKLKLNQDGTFEEILEKKEDTTAVRRTGKWERADYGGESVVLHGALVARNYSGTVESDDRSGVWILRIDRAYNRFRLVGNEDVNLFVERNRR